MPEEITLNLAFFSAFEDLRLQTSGTMESNGIRKLYQPSPVGRVDDLLGRVPLQNLDVLTGKVPPAEGSHIYEINAWLFETFQSQKQKGSAESPDLKHPDALGTRWETSPASKLAAEDI